MATAPASGIRLKASSSDSCESDWTSAQNVMARPLRRITERPDVGRSWRRR